MGNEAPVTGSSPLGATQLDTDGALWLGEYLGEGQGRGAQGSQNLREDLISWDWQLRVPPESPIQDSRPTGWDSPVPSCLRPWAILQEAGEVLPKALTGLR